MSNNGIVNGFKKHLEDNKKMNSELKEWLDKKNQEVKTDVEAKENFKKQKKLAKKSAIEKIGWKDYVKGLGIGATAAVAERVGWNFAYNKMIDNMIANSVDNSVWSDYTLHYLAEKYADRASEYNINLHNESNWDFFLGYERMNGDKYEADALREIISNLYANSYPKVSLNTWLYVNDLSDYITNARDNTQMQIIKDSYVDRSGFTNPDSITQQALVSKCSDIYNSQGRTALIDYYRDYVLYCKSVNAPKESNIYTDDEISNILINKFGFSRDFLDKLNFNEQISALRIEENFEYEKLYGSDMRTIEKVIDEGMKAYASGDSSHIQHFTKFWNEYFKLENTIQQDAGRDDWSLKQVLQEFGDTNSNRLAMADKLNNPDYIFAQIMESKYGVDCLKSDGSIDFSNTGSLSGRDLSNYRADVSNFQDFLNTPDSTNADEFLKDVDLYNTISGMLSSDANTGADVMLGKPLMLINGATVALGVYFYRRHRVKTEYKKALLLQKKFEDNNLIVDAEHPQGITKDDYAKEKDMIEKIDNLENVKNQKDSMSDENNNINILDMAKRK